MAIGASTARCSGCGTANWRGDWARGPERFSVNANAWRGREGQPRPGVIAAPGASTGLDDIQLHGANVTGHWEHVLDGGGSVSAQAYYDIRYRRVPPTFTDTVDIADLQLRHALAPLGRHRIVWGGEYRYNRDRVDNSRFVAFLPASDRQAWASLFAQDDVALRDDLHVTAGARWERNPYTGVEFLPTVRAPRPRVSYSVTAFRNLYDHLRTQDITPDGRAIVFGNLMEGTTRGIEAWGNVQMSDTWRIAAGATLLREVFVLKPGSRDRGSVMTTGRDPAYTAQLRSSHVIDEKREVELAVRRNGALGFPYVPAYWAVDARFGWRVAKGMVLSAIGTNLNGGHAEFSFA
jgi:iron complex outermembrane receptor protein